MENLFKSTQEVVDHLLAKAKEEADFSTRDKMIIMHGLVETLDRETYRRMVKQLVWTERMTTSQNAWLVYIGLMVAMGVPEILHTLKISRVPRKRAVRPPPAPRTVVEDLEGDFFEYDERRGDFEGEDF